MRIKHRVESSPETQPRCNDVAIVKSKVTQHRAARAETGVKNCRSSDRASCFNPCANPARQARPVFLICRHAAKSHHRRAKRRVDAWERVSHSQAVGGRQRLILFVACHSSHFSPRQDQRYDVEPVIQNGCKRAALHQEEQRRRARRDDLRRGRGVGEPFKQLVLAARVERVRFSDYQASIAFGG
jgi:hypothetical protein